LNFENYFQIFVINFDCLVAQALPQNEIDLTRHCMRPRREILLPSCTADERSLIAHAWPVAQFNKWPRFDPTTADPWPYDLWPMSLIRCRVC